MTGHVALALAAAAFVGTHFLMSHPLRPSLVDALGERAFAGVYSLVSLLTFGLAIWVYQDLGREAPLWPAGEGLHGLATAVMWFGSILFVGSFQGNPALPRPGRPIRDIRPPAGVFNITRHPMMWGFALWAIIHILVVATPKALILDGAILLLALGGSVGQDIKKRRLLGDNWDQWTARTAFVPFGRGFAMPSAIALVGGTLLFVLATWLHPQPVGIWHWIG